MRTCGAQKLGPTENLFHVTLLHQFKELRSARWKSIDSNYVRAAWSFDEAQVQGQADGAFVPVIGRPCEGVSRLNDLRAVENFVVNFVGETLLDTERQIYDFRIGLGVVLRLIADIVFPRVVENKIELGVLQRERLVQGFEESCFPGLVLSDKDGHIRADLNRRGILDRFVFKDLGLRECDQAASSCGKKDLLRIRFIVLPPAYLRAAE